MKLKNKVKQKYAKRVYPDGERVSPAEYGVIQLLILGNTEKEVAGLLGRSVNTIHKHTQNIRCHLGKNKRNIDILLFALREGIA